MKKKSKFKNLYNYRLRKLLLIMKLSFLITLIFALQTSAKVTGQEGKLSKIFRNAPISAVLNEIERNSEYQFIYYSPDLTGLNNVTAVFKDAPVKDVMNECFKNSDLKYEIENKHIVIFKDKTPKRPELEPMQVIQQKLTTITGVILDDAGGTLPGANVMVKGSTNATSADMDGKFKITAPLDAVLVVSFIGMKTKEVQVNGRIVLEIKLESDMTTLDEVVAIGYQKVHKRDLTASVSSIRSEELESTPVTSVSSLLATQSTGLQNVVMSGAPGSRGAVVIRGNSSISGQLDANSAFSNPLYVIDGVQTSLEDLAGYNVSNIDFLASLNPSDIESIDILKDASAAAIYGSRGANGVIIINTKKGKALDKPEFTFTSSVGFQPKPELVTMLTGTAERRAKMAMINRWWSNKEQQTDVPMMLTDSLNPAFNNNVDYQGMFYQTGITQKYSFSMRGGSEFSNYRVSLGYDDNKGVIKGTGFDRYTFSANLNNKAGRFFKNQLTTRIVYTDSQTGQGNPYQYSYGMNSVLPVNPASLRSSLFQITDAKRKSLEGELDSKMNEDKTTSITVSDLIQFQILDGLSLNSQLSFAFSSNKKNFYEPSSTRSTGDGFASYALYNRLNLSSDTYASYFKRINDHEFTVIAGQKVDYNKYENMFMTAIGFGNDAIQTINSRYKKEEIGGRTDLSANALMSYFGRFSYKFKNRYIIGGSFSIDGSSRFGTDVRWAKFPSLSAAWVFSDEPFLKKYISSFIDYGKIKYSWGINGKQFQQNYLRFGAYNTGYGGNVYYSNQMNVSSYGGVTGIIPNYNAIGNNKLSWENSTQWNLGCELDMFNQRLSISFDAYNKKTDKLFFDVIFPNYSGYNRAQANVAGIINYGWETMITYHVFPRYSKLRLELTLGLSQNKNYISKLPNGNRDYTGNDYGYVVGRPINLYKMFINDYILDDVNDLPVNPYTGQPLAGKSAWAQIQPGFPIWKDMNGDYILNETHDLQLARDYSPVPDMMGSFNINLQYKGWYLRAYSQFSFGSDIKNTVLNSYMDRYDRGGDAWAKTGLADLSDYSFWQKPGDGSSVDFPAIYPSSSSLGAFYRFRGNQTMWIESGDYWKITNASIGYNFDKKSFIGKYGLTRLRLYASIMNPWMWQRSKKVVDASMVDAKGHVMGNGYPQAKTISFGVDLRF